MLERTSACLDTGVRLSLRAQRRAPKSRRLLHHQFWQQHAPDLDLPISHIASVSVSASAPSAPVPAPTSATPVLDCSDAPFLDFLYPVQTLAFMNRLSQWNRRNTRLPVLRGYSSLSTSQDPQPPQDPTQDASSSPTNRSSPFLDELREILDHDPSTPSSTLDIARATHLHSTLDHDDPQLQQRYIFWLSHQKSRQTSIRALELFSQLPDQHKSPKAYHAAIAANLDLGHESEAIRLHEEAANMAPNGPIGSNLLMAHAITNSNWPLAKSVLRFFRKYVDKSSSLIPSSLLWDQVKHVDNLAEKLDALLLYRRSQPDDPKLPYLFGPIWIEFLALETRSKHFQLSSLEGDQLRGQIRRFIHRMHHANLTNTQNFEKTLWKLLSVPNGASNPGCNALIVFTYMLYRRSGHFSPSQRLLESLLQYWEKRNTTFGASETTRSFIGLSRIVSDFNRFHGRLSDRACMLIMNAFAITGNVAGVEHYAAIYKSERTVEVRNSDRLWPLIYVQAILAAPTKAKAQLVRLKQEFGVNPNLRCWNIVVHAFERANDLPGAVEILTEMLAAKIEPDAYTYGPLLNLCAKRGDVDGANQLLELARTGSMSKISVHMLNSIIVAHVNSDDMEGAQQALGRAVEAVRAGQAEGSLTICFNTILLAHALGRDLNATMETYRRMKSEGIALDERSYGALIQVLCSFRQTPSAHKILHNVIPAAGLRPMSFHYAIIMAGYVNQDMYERALQVQQEMASARIRATPGTRVVGLKAKTLLERKNKGNQFDDADNRIPLQDSIDDFVRLLDNPKSSPLGKQPSPGFRHESAASNAFDVGHLVYIHGKRRCFEAVQNILRTYQEKSEGATGITILRLMTTIMSVHCQAKEYAEVDRYWELIKARVDQLRLEHPTASDLSARLGNAGTEQPQQPKAAPPIPPALRFILSRPLRYYIISQFVQFSPNKVISTVLELLSTGFALDNRTWNTYIVHLCRTSPPRALLAFTLVEKFLMRDWPGWITARRGVFENSDFGPKKSARVEGLEYVRSRYLRPGQLMPQYRTMVHLARALLEVRGFEASGYARQNGLKGPEQRELNKQVGSIRAIREKAPRTMHAVQSMPRVLDRIQADLLGRVD